MTSREELITLINHISDEHADKLLASARIMVTLQKRCGRTKPSVTEKSLCAEDICALSDEDAREVWIRVNSLHIT